MAKIKSVLAVVIPRHRMAKATAAANVAGLPLDIWAATELARLAAQAIAWDQYEKRLRDPLPPHEQSRHITETESPSEEMPLPQIVVPLVPEGSTTWTPTEDGGAVLTIRMPLSAHIAAAAKTAHKRISAARWAAWAVAEAAEAPWQPSMFV